MVFQIFAKDYWSNHLSNISRKSVKSVRLKTPVLLSINEAPHRVAWLRDWPYFSAWLRENDFISAWLRESTCLRDAWKRWKMCVISWNHSKTCVIAWKACFSPNFSVFTWKSQFFIDCVNAWKWKKICVIAWLGTPLGGLVAQYLTQWPTLTDHLGSATCNIRRSYQYLLPFLCFGEHIVGVISFYIFYWNYLSLWGALLLPAERNGRRGSRNILSKTQTRIILTAPQSACVLFSIVYFF